MEQSEKCRIGIVDLMSFFWTLAGARKKGEDAFGLALQVLRYMRGALEKMHKLDAIAFCADGPGPSWRTAVDAAYKAHREEKPADRREELAALMAAMRGAGMCVIEEHAPKLDPSLSVAEEVLWFEGDDLCASAVAKALEGGDVPVVFSNDGDLAQLLALPGAELYSTRGESITADRVFREWGVMPAKLGDLKALAGDAGDGYKPFPGGLIGAAKGIGEKGAVDLIKAFGGARDAMSAALNDPTASTRVPHRLVQLLKAGGTAALDRGLKLALLRSDAPLPDGIAEVTSEDWDSAEAALKKREDEQRQAARLEDEREAEIDDQWLVDNLDKTDPRKAVLSLVKRGNVAKAREIVERMIAAGEDVSGLTVLLPPVARSIPREGVDHDPGDHGGTPHDDDPEELSAKPRSDLSASTLIRAATRAMPGDPLARFEASEPVLLTAAEYWALAPLPSALAWLRLPSEAAGIVGAVSGLFAELRPIHGGSAFFAVTAWPQARDGLVLLAECANDVANGCTSASDPDWRKLLIAQIKRIPGALFNLRNYGAPLVRAGT